MPLPPDVGAVVVAAGRGRRAGAGEPKQFRLVAGVPVLLRALRPFLDHPQVARVVVVLPPETARRPPDWLTCWVGDRVRLVEGGAERMDSVERGLDALGADLPIVVIHDGARPFPDRRVIDAVLEEARAGRSAIAAVPVSDTLKEGAEDPALGRATIRRTVARDGLWRAQTPQAFPQGLLAEALRLSREAGLVFTDDAGMVEQLGLPVVLVPDTDRNLKITSTEDFRLAEALAGIER